MTHTVHLHLEETDNPTLQRLCGSFDSNLDSLAKALDIHISRRFEHFTFNGAFAHAGKRALLKLLETAQTRDLNDSIIRLAAVETQTEDAGHQEKNHEHAYYFRTKRGSIGGRTPRQNGYIRALLDHDIVFGLAGRYGQNLSCRRRRRRCDGKTPSRTHHFSAACRRSR